MAESVCLTRQGTLSKRDAAVETIVKMHGLADEDAGAPPPPPPIFVRLFSAPAGDGASASTTTITTTAAHDCNKCHKVSKSQHSLSTELQAASGKLRLQFSFIPFHLIAFGAKPSIKAGELGLRSAHKYRDIRGATTRHAEALHRWCGKGLTWINPALWIN